MSHITLYSTRMSGVEKCLSLKMENNVRILGIDPGTNVMGYCVLHFDGHTYKLERIGSLKLKKSDEHLEKLKGIVDFVQELLNKHKPGILAIEEPFYGKNVQSMLKLGRAQGAVIALALQTGLPVIEITPRRVKQSITGSGSASKEQVAAMASRLTGMDLSAYDDDATDAVAIAITYTLQRNSLTSEQIKKTKKESSSWAQFITKNPDKLIQ